jgi:hypothetical protein
VEVTADHTRTGHPLHVVVGARDVGCLLVQISKIY